MFRRSAAVVVALAVTLGATACQPEPTPTPTGPAFASEDEAFAAAEETYRAYVDALNQVDLSDPETFEAVYAWTTGEANAGEKKSLTTMAADGWSVTGDSSIRAFFPDAAKLAKPATVSAIVCSDVSDVVVTDASGQSMVSGQRPDVYALRIDLIEDSNTSTGLAIATSNAIEDARCTS